MMLPDAMTLGMILNAQRGGMDVADIQFAHGEFYGTRTEMVRFGYGLALDGVTVALVTVN
jgi:hypothetical protein